MSSKRNKTYYVKRKRKLMREFESKLSILTAFLSNHVDESRNESLFKAMRERFEAILPEIPFIGGAKNPFTMMLIEGAMTLAMCLELEREGLKFRDIAEMFYAYFEEMNRVKKDNFAKANKSTEDVFFTEEHVNFLREFAKETQEQEYPYNWVFEFVEGDGETFDYGMNFSECGDFKFFKKFGAEKYCTLLCLGDFAEANVFGFGFPRTKTIGFGAETCDHRYKKGGHTPRVWPPDDLPEVNGKLFD